MDIPWKLKASILFHILLKDNIPWSKIGEMESITRTDGKELRSSFPESRISTSFTIIFEITAIFLHWPGSW